MTRFLYLSTLICLFAFQLKAQVFYTVTHTIGPKTIPGGLNVYVSQYGTVGVPSGPFLACSYNCEYGVGGTPSNGSWGAFKYEFWPRLKTVRLSTNGFQYKDTLRVFTNGSKYSFTSANVVGTDCGDPIFNISATGELVGPSSSPGQCSGIAQFTLSSYFDSLRVLEPSGAGFAGIAYNLKLADLDSGVNVYEPFVDTNICSGDTIMVGWACPFMFHSGNYFTVELSDPSGSFTSSTILGSKYSSDTFGWIACPIPQVITPGNNYHIRIRASQPYKLSLPNYYRLTIGVKPPKPVASANTPICEGHTLNLTTTGTTSSDIQYRWIGPNAWQAFTKDASIPNISVIDSGLYIVEASSFGICADSSSVRVVVNPGPGPVTASSNSPVCFLDTLKLRCTNALPSSTYNWTGPALPSGPSKDYDVPAVFASGKYAVTVTLNSCTRSDTIDVIVKPKPAGSAPKNNSPLCLGDTIRLTITTVPGASYAWTGPINTFPPSVNMPVIPNATAAHAGKYYVKALLDGCKWYDSTELEVKPSPTKPKASSTSPVCKDSRLYLYATDSTAGVIYKWEGPQSYMSVVQNPTIGNIGFDKEGNYIVHASLNGCFRSDTVFVKVNPVPLPTAISNEEICAGDTIVLIATDTLSGVSYSWTGPGNFSSSDDTVFITKATVSNTGYYAVLTKRDNCFNTDTVFMRVKPMPDTPVATNNSILCTGKELQLTLSNFGPPEATISWSGPGGFNTPVINPTIPGVKLSDSGSYIVVVDLDGCSQSDTTIVKVKPTPDVTIKSSSPVTVKGSISLEIPNHLPGTLYLWEGPDGFFTRVQNPIVYPVKPQSAGIYTVRAELNGCVATSAIMIEVNAVEDTGTFILYPNPNNGTFTISGLLKTDQKVKLQVHNSAGQHIYTEEAEVKNYVLKQTVTLPAVANGVYHLRFRYDGDIINIPFVVKQ